MTAFAFWFIFAVLVALVILFLGIAIAWAWLIGKRQQKEMRLRGFEMKSITGEPPVPREKKDETTHG